MDNKKNGIPKLRFPGFTGAWEQRKLGEVAEINPSSEIPDNFEYVDLESVVGTEMIAYRRENKKTAPSRAQRLAKKGDIFYQTVRPYQKNNYHFNLTRKDFVFSTGYAQLRPNINGDFLFVYIQLSNFVNEVLNRSTGTSYPAISPSNLIRMKVAIPTNNEQEKIGAFFKQLDSLIALHQRKLEHLQEQKKGLLQKMFPKNGETVPEVRFPGFTDAWEQRKLSELIQKGGSGGTPKSTNKAYYNGNIPFLGISDISKSNGYIDDTEKYISEKGLDNSSAWIVPKGAISLAMYASVGKLAILNTDAATSQAFYNMVFEDVSIRDYVYHRLGKANEFGEWTRLISTGTQSNLNADKVKNFKIQIPQIIDEIKNISTFFNQLDSLIALHQRKLDHLELMKKGLLQQMFV